MQTLGNHRYLNVWTFVAALFAWLYMNPAWAADADTEVREVETKSGVTMVLLPGGSFVMGDPEGSADEQPHEVTVSSFYIDKFKVNQEHYRKVMGDNPSAWQAENNPVEQVRWSDAVRYCNARSKLEGLTPCYDLTTWECDFDADGYRLPTEAEWEYAARAGTTARYFFGDDPRKLKLYAWFKDNARRRARPLGQKLPNPFGIYDIYGNVWEWCNDYYKVDYYTESPEDNPRGPAETPTRVLRGGSWNSNQEKCSSTYRYSENPGYTDPCFGYDIYGFRCVRNAEAPAGDAASSGAGRRQDSRLKLPS